MKSVEYYLKEKFDELGLKDMKPFIHAYCTSEDINNIAYQSMLRDGFNEVLLPKLRGILEMLSALTEKHKADALMARTHGRPASPTTFGKEVAVFAERLRNQLEALERLTLDTKFNGAVGNYNAHILSKPNVDRTAYSDTLGADFGFKVSHLTGQRGPMQQRVAFFQILQNINTTLLDFTRDIRLYNKDDLIFHKKNPGEVGSSVMPQKVNPWFIEEAEGMLISANNMFQTIIQNSDLSRLQRDMSGHPHERDFGSSLGQTFVAWTNIVESLHRITFDKKKAEEELMNHAEILTEGIQSILRREKLDNAYELLKALARGKSLSMEKIRTFIDLLGKGYPVAIEEQLGFFSNEEDLLLADFEEKERAMILDIRLEERVLNELRSLTPLNYIGQAPQLAEEGNRTLTAFMHEFDKKVVLTTRKRMHAVLFDFDNTIQLGDKDELLARINAINTNRNLGLRDEDIASICLHSDRREMRKKMAEMASVVEEDIQKANNEVTGNFDENFYLDEGSKQLIHFLKSKGIKTGIVSTRGNQSLGRVIEHKYEMKNDVDIVLGRDDVKERKPNPEGIETAMKKLGITPDMGEIYFIGDKFNEDVKAALNAGIIPIYIERCEEGIELHEKEKVLTFKNMRELYHYFFKKLI